MDHSHLAVAQGGGPAKRHRRSGAWVPSDSYLGSLVESSASRLNQATLTSIPEHTIELAVDDDDLLYCTRAESRGPDAILQALLGPFLSAFREAA